MYKNILVPVLFDEGHDFQAAVDAARALGSEGASFTVLHVLEDIPQFAMVEIGDAVLAGQRRLVKEKLATSAKLLEGAKPVLIHGHAGRGIVDYATENGVDCIVMASHQMGLSDYFLGSTASKVVRHAKCSVHVIR